MIVTLAAAAFVAIQGQMPVAIYALAADGSIQSLVNTTRIPRRPSDCARSAGSST